ncbi:MAG: maltotransferase domain-containing protein [Umezawaea sp.]
MEQRIAIEDVGPAVSAGARRAKAVVDEHVPVEATVWREGHESVAADVVWAGPGGPPRRTRMRSAGGRRRVAEIVPDRQGEWTFRVEAWSDPWATWRHAVDTRLAAGLSSADLDLDFEEGARLLERAACRPGGAADRDRLLAAALDLRRRDLLPAERVRLARSAEVEDAMARNPLRELVTSSAELRVSVERPRAAFGSWYEFFPRSTGGWDEHGNPVHGTFATATEELERVAAMGFDVVYLPPIHPIGELARKGPNNNPHGTPGDVGSPWAIGSAHGGHDAVHPDLGTLADFDAFVARAADLGIEVALDLALQCAPDHPWVREHPEWFTTRADGTIATAENPPKRYEDIHPLNFDNDPDGIYAEVLRVVLHWVDHGVKIFRVDNPHTKPPDFWEWLIARVREAHPDAVFLAEAFTDPARLYGLARRGFSQSYTYFTWRTNGKELTEFGSDLVEHAHEARPNLFVNTPDILPEHLQDGNPAVFATRAALAATLSPTWGVYSGFELFEHQALRPGSEEYLDSEKYQLRPREFGGGGTLEPWITRLNEIRRAHAPLRELRTLRFHEVDNDALLAYSKTAPGTGDAVLVVVNLDPSVPQEGTVSWAAADLGVPEGAEFTVRDEVTGRTFDWSERSYVRLDPVHAVAHIAVLVRQERS